MIKNTQLSFKIQSKYPCVQVLLNSGRKKNSPHLSVFFFLFFLTQKKVCFSIHIQYTYLVGEMNRENNRAINTYVKWILGKYTSTYTVHTQPSVIYLFSFFLFIHVMPDWPENSFFLHCVFLTLQNPSAMNLIVSVHGGKTVAHTVYVHVLYTANPSS